MATEQLPGFLRSVAPLLDRHGYSAVAGLILLEDFGLPLPGETILIAASIYAGTGRLNILAVGLIAVIAAVVGDSLGYALGRFGGQPLIDRFGRYVLLTPERVDTAQAFYERQGPKIVMFARFVEGLRQANGIIAGLGGMAWPTFLLYNGVGAVLWVAVWTSLGELAGSHITAIYNAVSRYAFIAAILAALVGIALLLRHRARRRRRRANREAQAAEEAATAGPTEETEQEGDPGTAGATGEEIGPPSTEPEEEIDPTVERDGAAEGAATEGPDGEAIEPASADPTGEEIDPSAEHDGGTLGRVDGPAEPEGEGDRN